MIRTQQPVPVSLVLTFAGLVVGLLGGVATAHACTCMPPGPPVQEMEKADAVFSARVVSVEPEGAAAEGEDPPVRGFVARLCVTLELEEVWKGLDEADAASTGETTTVQGNTVQVFTASQSAMCGVTFLEGERYLIYAHRSQGEGGPGALTATLCSRTTTLERAAEDVEALGSPERTFEAHDSQP